MRKLLAFALLPMLCSCALYDSVTQHKALDPVQVRQDMAFALEALRDAGCLTSALGTIAAPIVAISADEQGSKVLNVVNVAGASFCSIPAPAAVASPAGTTLGAVVQR